MMQIALFLPPPPGTPESSSDGGPNTLLVLVIVALILGAVVLVAWLSKPLVAKRLHGHETAVQTNAGTSSSRWNDTWSRNTETDDEQKVSGDRPDLSSPLLINATDTMATAPAAESLLSDVPTESAPVAMESREDVGGETLVEENETSDIMAITSTVRTLLERANAGRVREGFALYSEMALQRFRDEMGLTPEEFDAAFDEVPPPPPDQQAELAAITGVERLSDGKIRALVSYGNGGSFPPPEYFTFVRSTGDEWLIDEIAPA